MVRSYAQFQRSFSVRQTLKRLRLYNYAHLQRWIVKGAPDSWPQDLLQALYDLDYRSLTIVILLGYLCVAVAFLLLLYPAALFDERAFAGEVPADLSLLSATFYLSLGVLSQSPIALSDLEPATPYTVCVIAVEHFVGILMSACLLGVLINKASIPRTQIVFSDVLLWSSRNGVPTMMFRVGNIGGNFLLHPDIRVAYMRTYKTVEGEQTVQLNVLQYEAPPALAPCLNIACKISEDSNAILVGKSFRDIEAEDAFIHVALSATDNRHFQNVFATKIYRVKDMKFCCRFGDVMSVLRDGKRCVDFRGFDVLVENEAMPVTFGLSREELHVINGPDVQRSGSQNSAYLDPGACGVSADARSTSDSTDAVNEASPAVLRSVNKMPLDAVLETGTLKCS